MKIIFLDIDGVLNHQNMTDKVMTPSGPVSASAVKQLNALTDATDAKIVVSSTWRFDGIPVFDSLKKAGVTGELIGMTGEGCKCCFRGNEILEWIRQNVKTLGVDSYHDFKNYVILDDDSDMLLWQAENYIHVDPWTGMTPYTVSKAKRILSR